MAVRRPMRDGDPEMSFKIKCRHHALNFFAFPLELLPALLFFAARYNPAEAEAYCAERYLGASEEQHEQQ